MRVIHWTDEAMEQALKIKEYFSVTSPEYGLKVVNNLFDRVDHLIEFPWSGPVYEKAGLPQIRELLVRPYKVVYEVTDRQVRIMAVFHQRQSS